jgi:hypothetical protein
MNIKITRMFLQKLEGMHDLFDNENRNVKHKKNIE